MTCAETADALSRRRDGSLSAAELRALGEHLSGCPACRRAAQGLDEAMAALLELPAASPAPAFRDAVYARLAAPRISRALFPLAAGLLIGVCSAYVFLGKSAPAGTEARPERAERVEADLRDHARRTDAFVRQAAALGDDDAPLLLAEYGISDLGPRTRRLAASPSVPDDYNVRVVRPLAGAFEALDRGDASGFRDLRRVASAPGFRSALASLAGPAPAAPPAVPPSVADPVLRDFLAAKSLYYAGRPAEALGRFEDFRLRHPGSPLDDDAAFWMARAAAEAGDVERALPLYIELPSGVWMDEAELERLKVCAGSLLTRLDSGSAVTVPLPEGLDLREVIDSVLRNEMPRIPIAGSIVEVISAVQLPLDTKTVDALKAISKRHPLVHIRDCGNGEWEVSVAASAVAALRADEDLRAEFKVAEGALPFLFPRQKKK